MAIRRRRHQLASEQGFTLMEAMVTCAIIGILAAVSASLITNMFDSQIRVGQMLDQQSTIETYYGFMASRLAPAQRPIGLGEQGDDTKTDPLSLAGDQVIFESNGNCYRVFWIEDKLYNPSTGAEVPNNREEYLRNQIRASVASCSNDLKIKPVRGPNEAPDDDSDGDGFAEPGDLDFDWAIDSLAPDWTTICENYNASNDPDIICEDTTAQLAAGIVPQRPPYAPEGEPEYLIPYRYVDAENDLVDGIQRWAGVGTSSSWYNDRTNADAINSVDITVYIEAMPGFEGAKVRDRFYKQNISLQQVCSVIGGGGGGPVLPAEGDLEGVYPNLTIRSGAVNSNKIQDGTIQSQDIGDGEVNTQDIANNAVSPAKLGTIPSVGVYRSSNFSVANGSWSWVNWNAEDWDTSDMWSSGQGTQLVAPIDGVYHVTAHVTFAINGTGARGIAIYRHSGSDGIELQSTLSSAAFALGAAGIVETDAYVKLNAGQAIGVKIWQNSGSSLAATGSTSNRNTGVQMTWVSHG